MPLLLNITLALSAYYAFIDADVYAYYWLRHYCQMLMPLPLRHCYYIPLLPLRFRWWFDYLFSLISLISLRHWLILWYINIFHYLFTTDWLIDIIAIIYFHIAPFIIYLMPLIIFIIYWLFYYFHYFRHYLLPLYFHWLLSAERSLLHEAPLPFIGWCHYQPFTTLLIDDIFSNAIITHYAL